MLPPSLLLRYKRQDEASEFCAASAALCSVCWCRLQGHHHHPCNKMGRYASAAGSKVPHHSTVEDIYPLYTF